MRQRAGQRRDGRGAVLLYHRVREAQTDPYTMHVTPQHLEEHLRVIRAIGHPMPLTQFAQGVRTSTLPRGAVCVTFDDGYADSLYTAKPLLERYDVPASVFVTTGAQGRRREFWWDELERVFLQPGILRARLDLNGHGRPGAWHLGDAAVYDRDAAHRHQAWTLSPDPRAPYSPPDPTPRHAALRALHQLILPLPQAERQRLLDDVLSWADLAPAVRPTHRALAPAEVVELTRGGLVEVGAHTVNHLDLIAQPVAVQHAEIRQSKEELEAWLGHPVQTFAYPYGHYSADVVAAVRAAGFTAACACKSRPGQRGSRPLLLPRVYVFNWHGDEFAHHLRQWLGM